jgi:hypothetical protein
MELINQVCSLESAKRLDELGVKQDSYFVWENCLKHPEWQVIESWAYEGRSDMKIPAHTVAELLNILPVYIFRHGNVYDFNIGKLKNPKGDIYYGVSYKEEIFNEFINTERNEKFIKCLSDMLIYLLENNIIKADEINQTLNK